MTAAYTTPTAAAHPFSRSEQKAREMLQQLSSSGTLAAEHSEVESWLDVQGRELLRVMFQEHLELRAAVEQRLSSVVGADHAERTAARETSRGLETVFGDVRVPRLLYQAPGRVGIAPMDALLNLPPDHYSHGVRRMVAKEVGAAGARSCGST